MHFIFQQFGDIQVHLTDLSHRRQLMYKSQIKSNPCEQSNCSWPLQISLQGYRRKELVYLELLLVGKLSNTSDPRLNRWSAYRGAWFLGVGTKQSSCIRQVRARAQRPGCVCALCRSGLRREVAAFNSPSMRPWPAAGAAAVAGLPALSCARGGQHGGRTSRRGTLCRLRHWVCVCVQSTAEGWAAVGH